MSAYFVRGVDLQRPDEPRLTISEYGYDFFKSIIRTGNKVVLFTDDKNVTKDPVIKKWMEKGNIHFIQREIDPAYAPHNQRFRLYQEYLQSLPRYDRPSYLMFSDLDVAFARDPFKHMQKLSLEEDYNVFALLEGFEANEWEGKRQTACFGSHLPPGYDDHRGNTPYMYYNCGSWGGRYDEAVSILNNVVSILFYEGDIIDTTEYCDQPAFNQAMKRISPYANIYSSSQRPGGLFAPFATRSCPKGNQLSTIYHKYVCPNIVEKFEFYERHKTL
eukprot:CFRG4149T1